jgi:hypothetical protein
MDNFIARFRLRLPGFILCEGFTPSEEDAALDFDLGELGFIGRLFDDVPDTERKLDIKLEREYGPGLAALSEAEGKEAIFTPILELCDSAPPSEVIVALNVGSIDPHTKEYGSRLLETVLRVQGSLVHLLRFSHNQFWLKGENPWTESEDLQGWLDLLEAVWLDPEEGWKRLVLGDRMLSISIYKWGGISKAAWMGLGENVSRLTQLREIPMWEISCANSVELLAQGNFRVAIVEVVTALEIIVKPQLRARLLATIPDDAGARVIDKLVERAGLRAATELLLAMNGQSAEAETIMTAIELRNQIIHNSRRRISFEEARSCINGVRMFMAHLANEKNTE